MSTPVVTAQPSETIATVAQRMRDRKVGSVVVIDHDDRAIGILTERDMLRLAAAGSDASTAKVSEWMTANPDTVASNVDATAAFTSLAEHGYRHIPVVDGAKVVGIVSIRDLMRIAMIQPADAQAHEVPKGLGRGRRRRPRRSATCAGSKASTTTASTARSTSRSSGRSKTSGA